MNWQDMLKLSKGRTVNYTGTCSRCHKFVGQNDECKGNLPPQDRSNPVTANMYCPMLLPKNARKQTNPKDARSQGAFTSRD